MDRQRRKAVQDALRGVFGLQNFRPGQKKATKSLLSGRDLLCVLPTGAGKSLCWQLPAVVHPGLTVVVSPLIALMTDQVDGLRRKGIPAVALNSLMTPQERQEAIQQLRTGGTRIVFVAPERLPSDSFTELCSQLDPWLLVVDEAHCIVQWGEDFRPAYGWIGEFIRLLPRRPVVCAMTATADARMQRQIMQNLGLHRPVRVMLPILRENLTYTACTASGVTAKLCQLMAEDPCRTVVFCRKRHHAEAYAGSLRRAGLAADFYHAGLDRDARTAAQERFRTGDTQILCATSAFGMGIDIPDIRRVVHAYVPWSILDLVQQSGRAGRDGLPAECIVIITPRELLWLCRSFWPFTVIGQGTPGLRESWAWSRTWRGVYRVLKLLMTRRCIPQAISAAFGQRSGRCGRCSACRRGPLTRRVPDLQRRGIYATRMWLLKMQRAALARQRQTMPWRLADHGQMSEMASSLTLPDSLQDAEIRAAMARLMKAMGDDH